MSEAASETSCDWTVTGMDCGSCATKIKDAVARLPGVSGVEVGIMTERLRLTLDLETNPGDLYISCQQLQTPPSEAYLQGTRAITTRLQRLNPKAKLTRFIQRSGAVRQAIPAGVNEAVMYDEESNLLEGLSSNFYAVIDGAIWTAEEGVLSGITRSMVIECAGRLDIPLVLRPARLVEIPAMQEAFITSASRAVLPLSWLDEYKFPAAPGEITRRLMQDYAALLLEKLEEI